MNYTIYLSVRGHGLQLIKLTEEEKDELLKVDSLDDAYLDVEVEREWEYDYENIYLTKGCDRFSLLVEDENGDKVYYSDKITDLKFTKLESVLDEDIDMEDGFYLVRSQVLKGCDYTGEIYMEEEPFDPKMLHAAEDTALSEEGVLKRLDDTPYSLDRLFYQCAGKSGKPYYRTIEMDFEHFLDEQYFGTYLMQKSRRGWKLL